MVLSILEYTHFYFLCDFKHNFYSLFLTTDILQDLQQAVYILCQTEISTEN